VLRLIVGEFVTRKVRLSDEKRMIYIS